MPSEKSGGDPDGPRQKVACRSIQRVSQAPLLVANPADRECHLKTRSYTRSSSPGAAAPVFGRCLERSILSNSYSSTQRSRCCFRQQDASRASAFQPRRSEEHTSELQSLMRISYADFCLKKIN